MRGLLVALCLWAAPVTAQTDLPEGDQPILIVDYERLYLDSAYADRIRARLDADAEALKAENDRIVAALTEEERNLTLLRPTMSAEAFRVEAEAFDRRVQAICRASDAKEIELQQARVAARDEFYAATRDVIGALMLERGAAIILDRRSVFLALAATDITTEAIARIDSAMLEDGPSADPATATPLIGETPQEVPAPPGGE